MVGSDYGIIMGLLVVSQGLTETVKMLVGKIRKNGNGRMMYEVKDELKKVSEIISAKDTDGVPMCYSPRKLTRLQEKTLNKLDAIIFILAKSSGISLNEIKGLESDGKEG